MVCSSYWDRKGHDYIGIRLCVQQRIYSPVGETRLQGLVPIKQKKTALHIGNINVIFTHRVCPPLSTIFQSPRRAWLFADTPRGAFANGVLYTLVESAGEELESISQKVKEFR